MFDLLVELGADDETLDFPYIYASAREGYATHDPNEPTDTIHPILDMVIDNIPGPKVEADAPFQMMVTTLNWSEYVGRVAIGRINSGEISIGEKIVLLKADGRQVSGEVVALELFDKLGRSDAQIATAGDIVALTGLPDPEIGDTVCHPEHPKPLERVAVDEPTLSMLFTINSSPLAGREGKYVTSRHLRARLMKELESNVALRVEEADQSDAFKVSGRGLLHLSILIEEMRREGYELSIGKPQVIRKQIDGKWHEPFEVLEVDVPAADVGPVMEMAGSRRGQMEEMTSGSTGMTHLRFSIPARGLIGLRTRVLNATKGEAIMHHRFESFKPCEGDIPRRPNGVLISQENGRVVGYALWKLQERSELFVAPGDECYEGMVVGENSRDSDMVVNPIRERN